MDFLFRLGRHDLGHQSITPVFLALAPPVWEAESRNLGLLTLLGQTPLDQFGKTGGK